MKSSAAAWVQARAPTWRELSQRIGELRGGLIALLQTGREEGGGRELGLVFGTVAFEQ